MGCGRPPGGRGNVTIRQKGYSRTMKENPLFMVNQAV